jgi:hypothetical protein
LGFGGWAPSLFGTNGSVDDSNPTPSPSFVGGGVDVCALVGAFLC